MSSQIEEAPKTDAARRSAVENAAAIAADRFQRLAASHGTQLQNLAHAERHAEVVLSAPGGIDVRQLREAAEAFTRLLASCRALGGDL